jgi:parvulin-like peptidyl-prolyl isomerase
MIDISNTSTEQGEVVNFLKREIQLKEVYQRILYQRVINQAAQERGLTVTPEEIQAEANQLRREKRLEKASDTLAWLADQMITADDWEAGICDRLMAKKLAQFLFAKEAEKFFAQNKLDFDQILLYQIIVPYERLAHEIFYQIEEQEISFYEAAHLYDIDERRRQQCGYEGKLYRWSLKPDFAAVVFSAQLGEVIGPLTTEQGYHLLLVEEFIPAELTPERYQDIIDRMFKDWLTSELNYRLHSQTA